MGGGRRNDPPSSGLISLSGSKSKRQSFDSARGGQLQKKPRLETQDVASSELVNRVETLLASGNFIEAETLIVSVLNHIRANATPATNLGVVGSLGLARPAGLSLGLSRLPPAYTLGLLVLAKHQNGPGVFSRPAVQEQLNAILALTPRDFGITRLPSSAMANFAARSRGLHAFAANLLLIGLSSQTKWPTKLIKVYLEDSLSDRIWVDLDECRSFVLNLETAFPPVVGDPRALFTILCSNSQSAAMAVQTALGLTVPGGNGGSAVHQSIAVDLPSKPLVIADLSEAVSGIAQSAHISQSTKVIHGVDPARTVSLRFESGRAAVDVIVLNTLRDALTRRSTASSNLGLSVSSVEAASGVGGAGGSSSGGVVGISTPSTSEIVHIRCLIRTLALAAGLPEVRSLTAQRLEPWLTNPKLQILASALLAILAINCKQGAASPYDVDVMITVLFRIRLKLLKFNIQSSVLESICRLAEAHPNNLTILMKLCLASELPTISAICESSDQTAKQTAKQQQQQQQQSRLPHIPLQPPANLSSINSPSARCLSETVRTVCSQLGETEEVQSTSNSELTTANANLIAIGAAEALAKGHTSVAFVLPRLYQRFPSEWTKIVAQVLHDRIIETIICPGATSLEAGGGLPAHPTDSQLVAHTVRIFASTRKLLHNLAKWIKMSAGANTPDYFLPCTELGFGVLLLDRSLYPSFPEAAASVAQRLKDSCNRQTFGPFTILRYIYGVVHVICQLQLLSVTRPNLCDAPAARKKTISSSDTVKQHQACVRQLRLNFLRWFKSFVPHLISSSAPNFTADAPRDAFADICLLMRRAFFLEVATPLDDITVSGGGGSSGVLGGCCEFARFYAADELWPTEQNQRPFVCHLTYVNLTEKLAIHVLRYGLESQWGLVSPPDVAAVVCELIWRSAAFSIDSGYESSNFTKLTEIVDLLYACCAFCTDREVPSELTELAYGDSYWRVSLALVALAAHSPKTCGSYLWMNYPTVRRLMELVITNNFSNPPWNAAPETTSVESERLNKELENQLILQLEAHLARPIPEKSTKRYRTSSSSSASSSSSSVGDDTKRTADTEDTPIPGINPSDSKMIGLLVRNNPRGACRYPPEEQITILQGLCEHLGLRRRLCSCRQPDLLLELITSCGPCLPQPWVIQLVESMGQAIDTLPLQCLSEYLLFVSVQRIRAAEEANFTNAVVGDAQLQSVWRHRRQPSISCPKDTTGPEVTIDVDAATASSSSSRRVRLNSASSHSTEKAPQVSAPGQADSNRRRLFSRILDRLRSQARVPPSTAAPESVGLVGVESQDSTPYPHLDNAAEAMLQSFANRLKDASSLIRRAARYCLSLLAVEDVAAVSITHQAPSGSLTQPLEEMLCVLLSLTVLPCLSATASGIEATLVVDPTSIITTRTMDLLNHVLNAILVEEDVDSLTAYIIFLGQITRSASFVVWRPAVDCLSRLVLNRKALVQRLLASTDSVNIQPPPPPPLAGEPPAPSHTDEEEETGIRQSVGFIVLENVSRVLALGVHYCCTTAGVIPVNEKNSVFVAWSQDQQCPLEVEIIESHLVLLSWIPKRFSCENGANSWWKHLLNMWLLPDGKGAWLLPSMVSFTSSPLSLSCGTSSSPLMDPVRTQHGLFSLIGENKPLLSDNLRSSFLISGLSQLISIGLWGLQLEDLLRVICITPPNLLTVELAGRLYDLANESHPVALTPKQTIMLEALKQRAKEAARVTGPADIVLTTAQVFANPCTAPPVLTPRKLTYPPMSPSRPGQKMSLSADPSPLPKQPPFVAGVSDSDAVGAALAARNRQCLLPNNSKGIWRSLVAMFVHTGRDFVLQSRLFCCTFAKLNDSPSLKPKWMQDLANELQLPPSPSKRAKVSQSAVAPFLDLLHNDLPTQTALVYTLTLIRICLVCGFASEDPKLSSRHRKTAEFCLSRMEQSDARNSALMEHLLIEPLKSILKRTPTNKSTNCQENFQSHPMLLISDHLESSPLDVQMKTLINFGISIYLPNLMDTHALQYVAGPSQLLSEDATDTLWTIIRSLVFKKEAEEHDKTRYLLEELVHNSGSFILRSCLRNLLQENVASINSTLALDMVTCVLNLPAFSSSVAISEPQERPDAGTLYSRLHRFCDPAEGMRLIAHVYLEASSAQSCSRDRVIAGRASLVDLALQCHLQPCLLYLEYLSGWVDASHSFPADLTVVYGQEQCSAARSLLLCLYLRRPGIIWSLKSPDAPKFLRTPSSSGDIPKCFEHKEISRLGPSLLIGLSGSSKVVRETSALGSLALAIHHPRLCLPLLPLIAGLSQGRLDTSLSFGASGSTGNLPWGKFVARHHVDFYAGLLHFMEVLASSQAPSEAHGILFSQEAEQYKNSINEILSSLIHVAACYPTHATKMASGFSGRLSRLLLSYRNYASWAHIEGSGLFGTRGGGGGDHHQVGDSRLDTQRGHRTQVEMERLASLLQEFTCFPTMMAAGGGGGGGDTYIPLPFTPLKPPKNCTTAALKPFIQRLRRSAHISEVLSIVMDLDVLTTRKVDALVFFQAELEYLILNPLWGWQKAGANVYDDKSEVPMFKSLFVLLLKLLFRLLHHRPEKAEGSILSTFLPGLLERRVASGGEISAFLNHLPDACLLAPRLAPRLLHATASLVCGDCSTSRLAVVQVVSTTLSRLSLDGVNAACIEHAASGLLSTATGPKFATT